MYSQRVPKLSDEIPTHFKLASVISIIKLNLSSAIFSTASARISDAP